MSFNYATGVLPHGYILPKPYRCLNGVSYFYPTACCQFVNLAARGRRGAGNLGSPPRAVQTSGAIVTPVGRMASFQRAAWQVWIRRSSAVGLSVGYS